ncbi:MAG: hypothetical protein NXI20_08550 [bacterium]|nr:hypothetical protein [bacterium]
MTNIGIVLSDNSKARNCLGLALEIEEKINDLLQHNSRLLDLQDYKNDSGGLIALNNFDAVVIIVQGIKAEVPECILNMVASSYPALNQLPVAVVVNANEKIDGEMIHQSMSDLLNDQESVIFEKKNVFNKIEKAFDSSYQVIDREVGKKLDAFLTEFISFLQRNVPKSPNKVLSESV